MHFDNVSKGNLGKSGVGRVILDTWNKIISIGAKYLPEGTNNVVECLAAIFVLQVAKQNGHKKIHLQ